MTEEERTEIVRQLNTLADYLAKMAKMVEAVANRLIIVGVEHRSHIASGGDGEAD
jgi:hypothetical protein